MKKKVARILALSMALVITWIFDYPHVFAQEYKKEENYTSDDMEINFSYEHMLEENSIIGGIDINIPEDKTMETRNRLPDASFNADLTGDEILLYADGGIQRVDEESGAGQESVLRYGSVSGYLSETGAYELYSLNLSAGEYLQARLSLPSNTTLTYALVLYDSQLNVIKTCHYIPYLNGATTLEESIGYLSISGELVYIGVFSLMGGSKTEAFTLDFSVRTNYLSLSDNGEPNENVQEAAPLVLGDSGASISGMLNSAIDNDWYSFTVIDSPKYNKIRLQLTSDGNGCKMEIYQNLTDDYFTMQRIGSGAGEGEAEFPAGTYYVRVISTNTFNEFDPADRYYYNLSVVPVSKVDRIEITQFKGQKGSENCLYPEGEFYRLYDRESNSIRIWGIAYYTKGTNSEFPAANVRINVEVENNDQRDPVLAKTYASTITKSNGWFDVTVSVNPAVGGRTYKHNVIGSLNSTHKYDFMDAKVWPGDEEEKRTVGHFYLLKSPLAD